MADPTANSKLLKSKQIKPCVTDSKLFKRKQIVFCVTATVFLLAAGYGVFSIWKSNESRDSANEDISASSVPTKQVDAGFGGSSAQQSNKLKGTIEKQSSNKAFNVNALSTTFLSKILTTESTVTSNIVSRTYDIIKEIEEEAKSTLSPKPQSGKRYLSKSEVQEKGVGEIFDSFDQHFT